MNKIIEVVSWPSVTRAIQLLVQFGIVDAVDPYSQISLRDLSAKVNVPEVGLRRIMRIVNRHGFMKSVADDVYAHTDYSIILRSDNPLNVSKIIAGSSSKQGWKAIMYMDEAIKTGKSGFSCVPEHGGLGAYEWHSKHDAEGRRRITEAMAIQAEIDDNSILSAYDFEKWHWIADIGGASGTLIRKLLGAYGAMRGILFDLPDVIAREKDIFPDGILNRCSFVGGDFFLSIPIGADCYVLKYVLHNWGDIEAVKILQNCHKAMDSTAKLLICETPLDYGDDEARNMAIQLDISMLTLMGGQERTIREYKGLLDVSGFEMVNIIDTFSNIVIMEATKKNTT